MGEKIEFYLIEYFCFDNTGRHGSVLRPYILPRPPTRPKPRQQRLTRATTLRSRITRILCEQWAYNMILYTLLRERAQKLK